MVQMVYMNMVCNLWIQSRQWTKNSKSTFPKKDAVGVFSQNLRPPVKRPPQSKVPKTKTIHPVALMAADIIPPRIFENEIRP